MMYELQLHGMDTEPTLKLSAADESGSAGDPALPLEKIEHDTGLFHRKEVLSLRPFILLTLAMRHCAPLCHWQSDTKDSATNFCETKIHMIVFCKRAKDPKLPSPAPDKVQRIY